MKRSLYMYILIVINSTVQAQLNPVVIKTRNTHTLIPEGIAVSSRTGKIYVTSIAQRKIIVIDNKGKHIDFIPDSADGFGEGLGIKIDGKRNLLWAVSNRREGKLYKSMVHVFDAGSGKTKFRFILSDTSNHFFNDLVLDENGNAYITATMSGKIFYANRQRNTLDLFLSDTLLAYPNGIEKRNNKLYIATYSNGLLVYDLLQKRVKPLSGYINKTYVYNLDGLGLYANRLYGVFNTDSLNMNNAIVEYILDRDGNSIMSEKIFHKGHSLFREPTTLSISGNKLYLLANSNLAAFNANNSSVAGIGDKLTPVAILVFTIK